ncbi:6237_t:CDS:1, partial [Gigaspora margarita]
DDWSLRFAICKNKWAPVLVLYWVWNYNNGRPPNPNQVEVGIVPYWFGLVANIWINYDNMVGRNVEN